MEQYRDQGLDMLWEHAQWEDKSVSVEAGLLMWLDRMKSGRFKVFRELNDFWDEFNLYHRRDGKVFAENDDLLCAVRYALMMLRFARTDPRLLNRLRVGPYWLNFSMSVGAGKPLAKISLMWQFSHRG